MRIIFINRYFYPDHSATSQMLADLAFGLRDRGEAVSVIASRLRYDEPDARLPSREKQGGVEIERVWTSRFGRASLAFRMIDYLTFYISAAWALARIAHRGDIVVAMTDPPALSILVSVIARARGAISVNWLQDIFPEVAEALQVAGRRSSLLFAPFRLLRNISLRHASMNVAIGTRMAERLREFGVDEARISVIPNWSDIEVIRPMPPKQNRLRAEWGLSTKFVVGYSGNLGRAHGIETLLDAIAATSQAGEEAEICWLFIGGGACFEQLRRETERRGIANVVFRPYQPREKLAESLSVADVHIVVLKPELEGLIVPSKFYGIAASGRPALFVGAADGEVARLINQFECGATIASGDGQGVAETLAILANDPKRCRAMGERARAMCEANFGKKQAIAAWSQLLESVLDNRQQVTRNLDPDRSVEEVHQYDETIILR
ncbi:glycosyltransferase family 4 protein [Hyphomicrobium facile]|uniref:glycosyltransferase family 4 protein n=1 Tax=Hyphomicrobium facile TaxID=51670 RepID=UPI000B8676BD|nr:glycosyltransferase family 4 protein [Hyphomicrobium facile]